MGKNNSVQELPLEYQKERQTSRPCGMPGNDF